MNQENKTRKVVILSMAALLIGSLLYIFGVSITQSLLPMIIYYLIALALYISSFLSVYNNNKQEHASLYKYIMFLTIFLIILISVVTINRII